MYSIQRSWGKTRHILLLLQSLLIKISVGHKVWQKFVALHMHMLLYRVYCDVRHFKDSKIKKIAN